MSAQIIQANTTPFTAASVDPITLDIIENALRNARDEMDAMLFRTAMSPGIREQHDAVPMIANEDGKMVVGQFGDRVPGQGGHGLRSAVCAASSGLGAGAGSRPGCGVSP